jgi:hypothetical protein
MKINVSLIITLTIITISFMLLAVLYTVSSKREIDIVMNIQRTHAIQAQKSIEEFFHYYRHSLEFFADMKEIKFFSGQTVKLLEGYYKSHSSDISGVTLINRSGIITNTVPYNIKAIGADVSQQKHNYGKILSPDVILSDVFETAQGFDAISMSLPVYSGDKVNGRISILFKFEQIAERYIKDICGDNPGSAILMSRDGTILYHKDVELIGRNANSLQIESLKMKGIFEDMSSGKSGTVHFSLSQNNSAVEHYGIYMPLNIINNYWSIFIITPASEIKKISRFFKFTFAGITLMIFAAGVFFSINLLRNIRIINYKKEELARSNRQLSLALEQVRQLNQLLPICSNCKKIRNDSGYWEQIETYIADNSEAAFTHSLCPDCAKKLYPEHDPGKKKI